MHPYDELVESFKLLEQYNLCWRWNIERFSDVVFIEGLWQGLCLNIISELSDDVFLVDSTFSSATAVGLHHHDVGPQVFGGIGVVGDLSIRMETEHTWLSEQTKPIDALKGELHGFFVWDNVVFTNL